MIFPLCTTQISGLLWIGGSCSDGTSQSRHCHQGSIVRFREPTLWEQGVGNTLLAVDCAYCESGLPEHLSPVRAEAAPMPPRKEQMRALPGMLVDAQEQERIRAASELHELQVIEEGLQRERRKNRGIGLSRQPTLVFGFEIWVGTRIWATEKWRANASPLSQKNGWIWTPSCNESTRRIEILFVPC